MCCFLRFFIVSFLLIEADTKKPSGTQEQAVWRLECELGFIADSECPVDGGWTPWSPWSACRGLCADVGHRHRTRQCINPPPSQDGLPCFGDDEEMEPCNLNNCTVQDYYKIVEGDAIRTEALHQLEAVPALTGRCLLTQCPYEAIEAALAVDNTWQINPESVWNTLLCVKYNLGCPIIGEWSPWGEWSTCGARCGFGYRWRLRRCNTPPPSNAHLLCAGTPLQADECQGDQCAITKRNFGGTWNEWGEWSPCSEHCGTGVRRRKRRCLETNSPRLFGVWGTHCRGQHDQLEVCENRECKLDGGWSTWGSWGACSSTCGAGKRSRFRSCTRPVPAGSGAHCSGSRTEVGSCHLNPCESFSHTVAVFNGESLLQYNFANKRSTLFHFYVRFLPLSPHGTLVRRGSVRNLRVRLSLQKWHICLDAYSGSQSCSVPRICSSAAIEPAVWHSALITVTNKAATLRFDDIPVSIQSTFSCDPELPNENMNIYIGERLHGEMQEMTLNFIPLNINIERIKTRNCDFSPSKGSNVAYEKAGLEEGYLLLKNDYYLRLSCHNNPNEWNIKLTLKPQESGTILFFQDVQMSSWVHLFLQNMRLKLKFSYQHFCSESSSFTEFIPDHWFDVVLSKKLAVNTIYATINNEEHLHVSLEELLTNMGDTRNLKNSSNSDREYINFLICSDEYYVGGVPIGIQQSILEDYNSFSGVIASISVNGILQDLHSLNKERYKNGEIQLSSRTASITGSYHETMWGKSNQLNLTCLHAKTIRSPNSAYWMYLDVTVNGSPYEKKVRSIDDGRVLKLVATADNDLRGFYTCRVHSNKLTRNIITYGVIGKVQNHLTDPDMTTAIAVITSVTLVLGTLIWLIIEGFHDLCDGYGFFRDAHLSPEETAEAICRYIDQNIHLLGSKEAADIAKARARKIGKQLSRKASFHAQEPQGMMNIRNITSDEILPSEPEGLPALPEVNSFDDKTTPNITFHCDQTYISSPCHGSLSSPRSKLTLSSVEVSPRILCSKLLLNKRLHSPREGLCARKNRSCIPRKSRSALLTIKSSSFVNQSPAEKVLQKFRALKSEDS